MSYVLLHVRPLIRLYNFYGYDLDNPPILLSIVLH